MIWTKHIGLESENSVFRRFQQATNETPTKVHHKIIVSTEIVSTKIVSFIWTFEQSVTFDEMSPLQVSNSNVRWLEFITHWPLWSIYIAHFSMNWSNYIVMQWLPTYLSSTLGANQSHMMSTAVPYIMNSLVSVGKCLEVMSTSESNHFWKFWDLPTSRDSH